MSKRTSVVVLGGGLAGTAIAQELDRKLDPSKHVLTLISNTDYYRYLIAALRPVVTREGNLETEMSLPLNRVFGRNYEDGKGRVGSVKIGQVADIVEKDAGEPGYVLFESGEQLKWDILVIATGTAWNGLLANWPTSRSEVTKFVDGWREKFAAAKSIVIVGSGTVGSELAGEIRDVYPTKELTMVHKQSLFLNSVYPDNYRRRVTDDLRKRNIRVITGDSVDGLSTSTMEGTDGVVPGRMITTSKGVQIPAELIVATVGGRGANTPFIKSESAPYISASLRPGGYLDVTETLQLSTNPNVFAAGDVVALAEQHTAYKAKFHAEIVIQNILTLLGVSNTPMKPYLKAPDATLVTNGRYDGVAYLDFFTIFGRPLIFGGWSVAPQAAFGH
ncbi:hypothetical protein FRC17_006600 [Serendipita sp. 399]|nr:hypothetical protein FRC17_006600 [Serendipita sp. 399]